MSNLGHPFGKRTIGCSCCPIVQDIEAGGRFPVGLLFLRLLTMGFLSQAGPLGGLHRASPVPFRASYFTPGLHLPGATAQRLVACLYRQRGFPPITSLRLVAHLGVFLLRRLRKVEASCEDGFAVDDHHLVVRKRMVGVNLRWHPLVGQEVGRGVFLIALALIEDDLDLYAAFVSVKQRFGNRRLAPYEGNSP
jgi:hypothetical protein